MKADFQSNKPSAEFESDQPSMPLEPGSDFEKPFKLELFHFDVEQPFSLFRDSILGGMAGFLQHGFFGFFIAGYTRSAGSSFIFMGSLKRMRLRRPNQTMLASRHSRAREVS